jgi:hypothetical protein
VVAAPPAETEATPAVTETRDTGRPADSSVPGGTGSPGKGAFLEAPRGREDGFMLGRKDPLFIIDKVSGAFGPLWRRTLAADRSRIPSCRGDAPRKVGVLELTQGPDLELTNPLLADA